jgi:hypothetical protein
LPAIRKSEERDGYTAEASPYVGYTAVAEPVGTPRSRAPLDIA